MSRPAIYTPEERAAKHRACQFLYRCSGKEKERKIRSQNKKKVAAAKRVVEALPKCTGLNAQRRVNAILRHHRKGRSIASIVLWENLPITYVKQVIESIPISHLPTPQPKI